VTATVNITVTPVNDPPVARSMELSTDEGISRVNVRVYRLPTMEDAIEAYVALLKAPDWAETSDAGLVRTAARHLSLCCDQIRLKVFGIRPKRLLGER